MDPIAQTCECILWNQIHLSTHISLCLGRLWNSTNDWKYRSSSRAQTESLRGNQLPIRFTWTFSTLHVSKLIFWWLKKGTVPLPSGCLGLRSHSMAIVWEKEISLGILRLFRSQEKSTSGWKVDVFFYVDPSSSLQRSVWKNVEFQSKWKAQLHRNKEWALSSRWKKKLVVEELSWK